MFADQTRQNRTAQDRTVAQTASRAVGPGTAQLTRLAVDLNGAAPVRQLRDMASMLDQRVATAGPLQRLMSSAETERSSAGLPTRHGTGLPRQLKSGIESLSGISMDGVNVHYNSSRPAQLNALAYARGNDIHVAPGKERHLPHEAWHVVQQAQGRVRPTMQMKDGIPVNDDAGLEHEADVMGAKAAVSGARLHGAPGKPERPLVSSTAATQPVQRQVPTAPGTAKPAAATGSYRARGGQQTIFDPAVHTRQSFSFGSNTRAEVFQRYNPQYAGNRIISIRGSHGEQVNVEGVQLDHQVSWDTIAGIMGAHNAELRRRGIGDISQYYTLWDAKMYYNDQSNLVPALGGINAAAGAQGVRAIPRIHHGLEIAIGQIQTSWMNLQAGLGSVGEGISESAAEDTAGLLLAIAREMNVVTDRLF